MRKRILVFVVFLVFGQFSLSYSLEKETHSAINQYISENTLNGFSLDTYLKSNLGFTKGKDQLINGQKVYERIRDGGKAEDEPMYTRSLNHFHNPLKSWDTAGFKGTFKSSVIWAQDQGAFGSLWGGDFSWRTVREYFYIALTGRDFSGNLVAYTPAFKEKYFGKTFQGIGQIMHLVQDASVPAHTRDDAHVVGYHYEKAVENNIRNSKDLNIKKIFEDAVANPITFDSSILSLPPNPLAPIPIAKIFDTDKYERISPDPNITVGNAIGISEYTNANFVSEGLISANFQDFPHPRIQDTTITGKSITGPSGTYMRQYYLKNCCGETNSGKGYLLAAVDYLDYWRQKHPVLSVGLPKIPVLDDNVYRDYASLLIPRAVGYSAGLLDYFFRGNIEISLPPTGIYSLAENREGGFARITLLARNTTSTGEEMTDGSIELVARYRTVQEDPFQPFAIQASNDYTHRVVAEANNRRTIPRDIPIELVFDNGQTAIIPVNAVDVSLQVVYKGRLGNEYGAVAAALQPVSDPTPLELANNMDRICLNGKWYVAGSPEAIAQVDTNNNGIPEWDIYPHNLKDAYVKISPPGSPVNATPSLYTFYSELIPAGSLHRAFMLGGPGSQVIRSHYVTAVKTDTADTFTHVSDTFRGTWAGNTIKSEIEYSDNESVCNSYGFVRPCTIRHAVPFYSFRGTYMWGPTGVIFDNPEYPPGQKCSWQLLQ